MACNKTKYVGKDVPLEFAIACPEDRPLSSDYKRVGAMRAKEFNLEWETADATADDTIGSLRSNLATFQTLTISGDGTLVNSVDGSALTELTKHFVDPVATSGQPIVWMRMTFPDLTFEAAMLLTTLSRTAPYDDVATYSLEASATASPFGLIVEDTPVPVDPTGVTVAPSTVSVAEGATTQLTATVAPVGAPQAVTWTSATPATATVSNTGLVTGVAEGTVVVTARSVADNTKLGTSTVTVTA
jgi:uncharacterized protein YjdB